MSSLISSAKSKIFPRRLICMKRYISLLLLTCSLSFAQQRIITPNDTLHSPVVSTPGWISFQLYAPDARAVTLNGGDIPETARSDKFVKQENGVWQMTAGPVIPGAYRYRFTVDKVSVLDPHNPATSESNMDAWSIVTMPGSNYTDLKDVPHGSVAEVTYFSTILQRFRRMHIYTPPGYESGTSLYPVFYLLHGAWDTDDAWHSVGRAPIIFDNLIAEKKAVPMIVVMPAGHTGPFPVVASTEKSSTEREQDEFVKDFLADIRPYVEGHYRVLTDRKDRAIAGLSMGGAQTLNIAIPHLADYAYIGVFSSGIFELGRSGNLNVSPQLGQSWEEKNKADLDNKELKEGLRYFWFATGKEDFLLNTSRATVEMFKKHGFDVKYDETGGGHTWINWRDYLIRFTPLLFKP
jgi:enterochelin esterase-like enzyme